MDLTNISRRALGRMAGSLAVAGIPLYSAAGSTAQDIVKQMQEHLAGVWGATGLDGFKAGKPETEVRGIVTTAMATMEVLQKASKAGHNLIVTHEPTFFGSRDGAAAPAGRGGPPAGPGAPPAAGAAVAGRGAAPAAGGAAPGGPGAPAARGGGGGGGFGGGGLAADDPVLKAKRDFIEKNNMVVFRLRDHWQARKENDRVLGLADSLGWSKHLVSGETMMFDIPNSTAEETVALIRKKLNLHGGVRAVGDPKSKVRRVMLYPGMMTPDVMEKYFGQVDLLLAGEVREWECVCYAGDMNSAGEKRTLVTIGRVASEDPGMRVCATWLKTFVKGVPVEWISAGDPFWRQS